MFYFRYMIESKQMLFNSIQSLRERMIQMGLNEGLQSKKTIEISQELDKLLNIYQALNK